MKSIGSFIDNKNKLYIDCSECKKGGNGTGECEQGKNITEALYKGCYDGQLLDYIDTVD